MLVATKDRAVHLVAMLDSLATEWNDLREVVVVDNGSSDGTAELLRAYAARQPKLRTMHVAQPGQSRALNRAIANSSGAWVAFLDDDVLVEPNWARGLARAFETQGHAGFQGRIRMPPEVRADPCRLALTQLYKTLPTIDYGTAPRERRTMTGANMAVRRAVLERVGFFDERLGPGAAGLSGDTDLAQRIRRHTRQAFAYVPEAAVVHIYDAARLTDAYHEQYHRRLGRSRMIQRPRPLFTVLPSAINARVKAWFTGLGGRRRAYYRHIGRYYAYSEMLCSWRAVPASSEA